MQQSRWTARPRNGLDARETHRPSVMSFCAERRMERVGRATWTVKPRTVAARDSGEARVQSQIEFWAAPQGNRPEMFGEACPEQSRRAQYDSAVLKRVSAIHWPVRFSVTIGDMKKIVPRTNRRRQSAPPRKRCAADVSSFAAATFRSVRILARSFPAK
jgi:hypothetical protein